MSPKEFVEELVNSHSFLYDNGHTVVDGPHVVSDQKVVAYVQPHDGGPRLRIEVTQ